MFSEYSYNPNGSITKDRNHDLSSIQCNALNLAARIDLMNFGKERFPR